LKGEFTMNNDPCSEQRKGLNEATRKLDIAWGGGQKFTVTEPLSATEDPPPVSFKDLKEAYDAYHAAEQEWREAVEVLLGCLKP
jgi:hypothetical protein